MTFEEWWKSKKTLIETVVNNNKSHIDLIVFIKSIMNIAWDTSQPKWTLCKDGMPTEDGNYLVAVLLPYGHRTVLSSDYNANNCAFWEIDPDREIIAWMSLPEAPNVHDD